MGWCVGLIRIDIAECTYRAKNELFATKTKSLSQLSFPPVPPSETSFSRSRSLSANLYRSYELQSGANGQSCMTYLLIRLVLFRSGRRILDLRAGRDFEVNFLR